MAILKIINKKDPILRKHSRPVEEITPRIIRLLDDMKDTLHKAGGGGACRCAGRGAETCCPC